MILRRTAFLAFVTLAFAAGCSEKKPLEEPAAGADKTRTGPASVTMSADAIRAAGVVTGQASQSTLVVRDELPGTIEAPRDGLAIVNTRVAGVVESLEFDVGDRVKAGQQLATVRSVELAEAQMAYQQAVVAEPYAAAALQRSESLRKDGVLSERRVEADRLEANAKKLALQEATDRLRILAGSFAGPGGIITISAPISGVIASRSATRGQALEANSSIYTIVDVSRVVVQLRALAGTPVVPGTKVPFTVEALPGRSFTAVMKSASDLLDPETRRFFVRCTVDNSEGTLKPGMFVTAHVPRQNIRAVTVPEAAVQMMPDGPVVFVAKEGGQFEARPIVPGVRADGQVAVEKGLAEGEPVVVQGAFWVRTQLQKSAIKE